MNDQSHDFAVHAPASAFRFTGNWREFLPIALTNLLLTLVTLGVYRFWAKARERRYLWSRTEFIDDPLEWTGTGLEMFKGFILVMIVLVPALLFFQFGFEMMVLRGQAAAAGLIGTALYLGLIALTGVARYRALRYRLSRTYWHGIRGGGEPGGWAYGWSYLWKTIVGVLALGLLVPWSAVKLWNERWSAMSFGPHRFESYATTDGLMGRWILLLAGPLIIAFLAFPFIFGLAFLAGTAESEAGKAVQAAILFAVVIVVTYGIMAVIGVGYFAAYLRNAVGGLELGNLRFTLNAYSMDWLKLFLGHALIVVATLGVGLVFISYRNWSFFIRHLEAVGEVDLDMLTQSTTDQSGDAEGLAAAFDIGAI